MCKFVFRCFLITTGLKLRHSVNLDSCVGVGTVRREGAFIFIRDDIVTELPSPPLSKVSGAKLQLAEESEFVGSFPRSAGRMRALLIG